MDSVNKWLVLAANIGVLVGIFILVVEIRQTQEQLDSQISYNLFNSRDQRLQLMASDPYLAEIASKKIAGEELSFAENIRVNSYLRSVIYASEYEWDQYEKGRFDDFDFDDMRRRLENNDLGYLDVWADMKGSTLDADFVTAVEQGLNN